MLLIVNIIMEIIEKILNKTITSNSFLLEMTIFSLIYFCDFQDLQGEVLSTNS